MTHKDLVNHSMKIARKLGFPLVLPEMKAALRTNEIPDIIAFRGGGETLLIECKTSRADYLADRNKPFRQNPETGVGLYRILISTENVVHNDLYKNWEHIILDEKGNIKTSTLPNCGNMTLSSKAHKFQNRNQTGELALLYSYARRLK